MLGSYFAPLSFLLIPAECESTQAQNEAAVEAYRAIKKLQRLALEALRGDQEVRRYSDAFCDYVCRIMLCSFAAASEGDGGSASIAAARPGAGECFYLHVLLHVN